MIITQAFIGILYKGSNYGRFVWIGTYSSWQGVSVKFIDLPLTWDQYLPFE